MSDISDEDWEKIIAAYKEAYPNTYPDKSMIVSDMIEAYISDLSDV